MVFLSLKGFPGLFWRLFQEIFESNSPHPKIIQRRDTEAQLKAKAVSLCLCGSNSWGAHSCLALGAKVTMGHMVNVRRALVAVLLLALAAFAWLWLTRPQRVDMTAYAPADSIVYVEADSLPAIVEASTSTDA